MTRFRGTIALIATIACAVAMTGCGGDDSNNSASSSSTSSSDTSGKPATGSRTIGILPANLSSDITRRAVDEASQSAKALGWKTVVTDPNNDPAKSQQAMQNFVNQGVDAIFVMATAAPGISRGLAAAKAKGIPVFSMLVAPEPSTRKFFTANIADDTEKIAQLTAQEIMKNGDNKNPIVQDDLTCNYAGHGFAGPFADEIKRLGGTIADRFDVQCTSLVPGVSQAAQTMLQHNQGPLTYVTLFDFAPPLLEGVFQKQNRDDITVYTRYDIPPSMALVRAGKQYKVIATDLSGGIFEAYNRLLSHWVDKKPLKTTDDLSIRGFKIIDKTNVPKSGDVYPFQPKLDTQVAEWSSQYSLGAE